jgi:prepilin-type N-terminal cleavage/methylation domain-containing protein
MRTSNRSRSGFTLTELMIGAVIAAIVISQSLLLFASQQKVYLGQSHTIEIQSDTRLMLELMLNDVRMAGFLVPSFMGISGADGGVNGPDILCLSDSSIIDANTIVGADRLLSGATLQNALTGGDNSVDLVAATMDIDGNGDPNDDFSAGNGIIISDGTNHHCTRIESFTLGQPNIEHSPPGGFLIPAGTGRAVPAIIYELVGSSLARNSMVLSRQVENLQVQYAVDTDNDGSIGAGEFPIHDISGSLPDRIRRLRLSVLTRTSVEDPANRGSRMPIAGNHVAGIPDNFLRRRFDTSAIPRNL